MSDLSLILIAVLGVAALIVYLRFSHPRTQPRAAKPKTPRTPVIVDGSNVMHWGGDPSVLVLSRVLEVLKAKNLTPIVYFDANVGYKLWGSYASSQKMAARLMLRNAQVIVVEKGVTADEILLKAATKNNLRVVTNDRFKEWRVQFPKVAAKGFLIKGEWRQGSVMLRGV